MTVLLDLPAFVLPLLLRDPSPLACLLDVLPEVGNDAQEQVIAAAWYLTGERVNVECVTCQHH